MCELIQIKNFDKGFNCLYHCAFMLKQLPELIEPLRLAEKHRVLKGELPLSRMDRLADFLLDSSGTVAIDLEFSIDANRWSVVKGKVEAQLMLQCQRCMEAMEYPLRLRVNLGIVSSADLPRLPEQYEPLLLDTEQLALIDIVEDELILGLPDVASHKPGDCEVKAAGGKSGKGGKVRGGNRTGGTVEINAGAATESPGKPERENPFKVLEQLKSNKKDKD
ncbi:MAG: YceD family protein [Gammaproteobacteria bacterium]|nr:YceD family protein [Gammaproteobacteria bacterium]MDH5799368.1 YceD family protein [Gammaproteobacteria bacterium]